MHSCEVKQTERKKVMQRECLKASDGFNLVGQRCWSGGQGFVFVFSFRDVLDSGQSSVIALH